MTGFSIGDVAYVATAATRTIWVTCPECLGSCRLRVILGDNTEVSIDCVCCERGIEGSPGKIQAYAFQADAKAITICGVDMRAGQPTRYGYNDCYSTEEIFGTMAEAEDRAKELVAEHEAEQAKRLRYKEKQTKSWAWNVSYHRRMIREAQKQIDYHTKKLNVAAKQPIEAA